MKRFNFWQLYIGYIRYTYTASTENLQYSQGNIN